MSQFISSYTKENYPKKKLKMKFYYSTFTHRWLFHFIPTINLYLESHSPNDHKRFWQDGMSGLYLSFQWGKWLLTIGFYKKL
jgi:hypothetical protein